MSDIEEDAEDRAAQSIGRAAKAANELALTNEAFDETRRLLIERWASTGIDHTATREKMFFAVQALDGVRSVLKRAVDDGAIDRHSQEMAALLAPALEDRR